MTNFHQSTVDKICGHQTPHLQTKVKRNCAIHAMGLTRYGRSLLRTPIKWNPAEGERLQALPHTLFLSFQVSKDKETIFNVSTNFATVPREFGFTVTLKTCGWPWPQKHHQKCAPPHNLPHWSSQAGMAGEFSSPESTLCADSYYLVFVPPPCFLSGT